MYNNDIEKEIALLSYQKTSYLRDMWQSYFDSPPPKFNKSTLVNRLAYRMQELEYGGLPQDIKNRLYDAANGKKPKRKQLVTRPVAGTKLIREYLTKKYVSGTGKERGGKPMNKQYLYRMFKNKIYLGKIVHKDKIYEGQHEAIISQELWDKAQAIFKEDPIKRGNYTRNRHPALLRSLVRCECCDCAMTPSFTVKKKRTYRYYTPTIVIHQHYKACKVGPIPASEIDALVVGQIKQMIESPEMLTRTYAEIKKSDGMPFDFGLEELRQKIKGFDKFWKRMTPEEQQRVTELLVKTVAVNTDAIKVDLRLEGFATIIRQLKRFKHGMRFVKKTVFLSMQLLIMRALLRRFFLISPQPGEPAQPLSMVNGPLLWIRKKRFLYSILRRETVGTIRAKNHSLI